jgi:hypothetical protein
MKTYHIRTDMERGTVTAPSLLEAVKQFFGAHIPSLQALNYRINPQDGGWCRIECDGETLVEIGSYI